MAAAGRTPTDRLVAGEAALVTASVPADLTLAHYRGSFRNPVMYPPFAASGRSIRFAEECAVDADTRRVPVLCGVAQAGRG